jgi:hypothetical protein
MDPYTIFAYGIRSPYTKQSYFRRFAYFLDPIDLCKGKKFEERFNSFAHEAKTESNWAFGIIVRFLHYEKESNRRGLQRAH